MGLEITFPLTLSREILGFQFCWACTVRAACLIILWLLDLVFPLTIVIMHGQEKCLQDLGEDISSSSMAKSDQARLAETAPETCDLADNGQAPMRTHRDSQDLTNFPGCSRACGVPVAGDGTAVLTAHTEITYENSHTMTPTRSAGRTMQDVAGPRTQIASQTECLDIYREFLQLHAHCAVPDRGSGALAVASVIGDDGSTATAGPWVYKLLSLSSPDTSLK